MIYWIKIFIELFTDMFICSQYNKKWYSSSTSSVQLTQNHSSLLNFFYLPISVNNVWPLCVKLVKIYQNEIMWGKCQRDCTPYFSLYQPYIINIYLGGHDIFTHINFWILHLNRGGKYIIVRGSECQRGSERFCFLKIDLQYEFSSDYLFNYNKRLTYPRYFRWGILLSVYFG